MNDLERDLQELFERQARDVDPSVLAPEVVIRRGRRRQARTAVGGVLAGVIAIALAVAAVGSMRGLDRTTPGGSSPSPLPERSAVIGGVPVTAPEGWTLIDDWPLAALLPTSTQTCSFSATGTAVDTNGSPIATSAQPEPSQACSGEPVAQPAGLPVLQVANFEIPLMQTVCGLGGEPAATVPPDGVAVYVTTFPADPNNPTKADTSVMEGCGLGARTMTLFSSADGAMRYAAIFVEGSQASPDDKNFADNYINKLDGMSVAPTAPESTPGPGYVLAAGSNGDQTWRLEAGITSFDKQDGTPTLGATLVTSTPHDEGSRTLPPATHAQPVTDDYSDVGDGVVQFGTATSDVTGIDLVTTDGAITSATMFPWPIALGLFVDTTVPTPSGWVWFAEGDVRADVVPTMAASASLAPTPSPELSATDPTAAALDYRVLDSGAVMATGNNFGTDWQLTDAQGRLHLIFGGVDMGIFSATVGGGEQQDVPGGTLWIQREPLSVDRVDVSTDVAGTSLLATGRWMPSDERSMGNDRIWVVALPGTGAGYSQVSGDLAYAMDWPTNTTPSAGDVISAGSSAGRVSWALRWTDQQCPTIEITESRSGDAGTSDCLLPWDGSTPVIGGVYGDHDAVVAITGPEDMLCDLGVSGGSIAPVGQWAHTGQCILTVPVGTSVTVQLTDVSGKPILGSLGHIGLSAEPGRLNVTN